MEGRYRRGKGRGREDRWSIRERGESRGHHVKSKRNAFSIIHNTVGRSIASISDLGGIYILALRTSVDMSPRVVYISYRPPYHTIYITKYYTQNMYKTE